MQNENSGNGLLLLGVAALIFFPVFFLVAIIVLLGLCMVGVMPKVSGIGLILFSFLLFGLMIQLADGGDSETVVPFVLAFLAFFLGGCALLISGLRKTTALQPNNPPVQTQAEPFCSKQGDEEKIQLAVQEARRVANLTKCSHEARKKIFENVFRRKCEEQGIRGAKLIWKTKSA